ncbi:hypothetical protein Tco_1019701 [Tanacetum coccineum]|uniref:Uncharacterized protein n=1 Tax=Tanacetum coccineum TaxID=301880 RepID=A0ABQ5FXU9_9ASTR
MKNSRCFLQWETVITNVDNDVDDSPENDLALNVDHVFEADECDAFDSDVDEGPTSQTMFMASLTSEDPIYDEAGPSYDSNNPFEVQDHDTFVDHMDEYHEVHEMQNDVQHNYVVDSDADYTSDSNIIPYDQYVEDNEEHVVQSNVSSVRNDALMSILDEMHEQVFLAKVQFRRTSLTGFPTQSIRSSNAIALDSPYLLVSLPERLKADNTSPTKSLFDVGSRRISIVTVNTKEYHSDVLAIITRIMRRTF